MVKFTLEKIRQIKEGFPFFKLVKNGECYFNDFIKSLQKSYDAEIESIFSRMRYLSMGKLLPKNKFRIIKGINIGEFDIGELKTRKLRVYMIIDKQKNHILVLGGLKKNQKKDIKKFKSIAFEYFEWRNKNEF